MGVAWKIISIVSPVEWTEASSPVPRLIMFGFRFVNRHSAFMAFGFLERVSSERWCERSTRIVPGITIVIKY